MLASLARSAEDGCRALEQGRHQRVAEAPPALVRPDVDVVLDGITDDGGHGSPEGSLRSALDRARAEVRRIRRESREQSQGAADHDEHGGETGQACRSGRPIGPAARVAC
jgi:hypothetical protein